MEEGSRRVSVRLIDVRKSDQPLLTLKMGKAMSQECRQPLEAEKGNKMDSPPRALRKEHNPAATLILAQ